MPMSAREFTKRAAEFRTVRRIDRIPNRYDDPNPNPNLFVEKDGAFRLVGHEEYALYELGTENYVRYFAVTPYWISGDVLVWFFRDTPRIEECSLEDVPAAAAYEYSLLFDFAF